MTNNAAAPEPYVNFEEEVKDVRPEIDNEPHVNSVGQSMMRRVHGGIRPNEDNVIGTRMLITRALLDMGYPKGLIERLLIHTEVQDAETAVDMVTKGENGWLHEFIPSQRDDNRCIICEDLRNEHIANRLELLDAPQEQPAWEPAPRPVDTSFVESYTPEDLKDGVACGICTSLVPRSALFALSCGHAHCKRCVISYLECSIQDGKILDLRCPMQDCEAKFTKEHIQKLCRNETYQKYLRFRENIEVNLNKRLRWCPAPNCGRYVECSTQDPHVVCQCGFHMCFKCGEAWHAGYSCEDYFDKLYNKWATTSLVQRCPSCRIRIEKNAGCNHMTCTFCGFAWCWICGMAYNGKHYDSVYFGCPGLQFTADWSLGKIVLFNLGMLLIWPIVCFFMSFRPVCEACKWMTRPCRRMSWLMCLIFLVLAIPFLPVVGVVTAVMFLPSFGYRVYVAGYSFVRYCRR